MSEPGLMAWAFVAGGVAVIVAMRWALQMLLALLGGWIAGGENES